MQHEREQWEQSPEALASAQLLDEQFPEEA